MKLFVQVKTGKRASKVTKISETEYIVEVTARAEKGKANEAVLSALAKHLGIAPSRLSIISGHTAKRKIVEVK